jgi:hypothetical protein
MKSSFPKNSAQKPDLCLTTCGPTCVRSSVRAFPASLSLPAFTTVLRLPLRAFPRAMRPPCVLCLSRVPRLPRTVVPYCELRPSPPSYLSYSLPARSASLLLPVLPMYLPHYHKNKTTNQKENYRSIFILSNLQDPNHTATFTSLSETAKPFQRCSATF